jgi:hypothetical protein
LGPTRSAEAVLPLPPILVLLLGMSKQIAVRLPDDLVEFIDQLVDHGQATSRAVVIAARDAAILSQASGDPDLDRLAEYAARTPLDDLA